MSGTLEISFHERGNVLYSLFTVSQRGNTQIEVNRKVGTLTLESSKIPRDSRKEDDQTVYSAAVSLATWNISHNSVTLLRITLVIQ